MKRSDGAEKPRPGFPAKLVNSPGPTLKKPLPARAQPGTVPMVPSRSPAAGPPAAPTASRQASGFGTDSQAVRLDMVRKLEAQGIEDPRVLAAMRAVERHRFVDSALANQAYEDTSLPIGLGQTISKPNVVARMLSLLGECEAVRTGRVLEIGTGCGYQAALLSLLCKEVYSIERLRGLHDKARENLRTLRVANLHLLLGDGMLGFAKGAPYAGIIAAAGGEAIPAAWIDQLAVGGRLVAPTSNGSGQQRLVVVDKTASGLRQTELEPVLFVPLKSGVL